MSVRYFLLLSNKVSVPLVTYDKPFFRVKYYPLSSRMMPNIGEANWLELYVLKPCNTKQIIKVKAAHTRPHTHAPTHVLVFISIHVHLMTLISQSLLSTRRILIYTVSSARSGAQKHIYPNCLYSQMIYWDIYVLYWEFLSCSLSHYSSVGTLREVSQHAVQSGSNTQGSNKPKELQWQ